MTISSEHRLEKRNEELETGTAQKITERDQEIAKMKERFSNLTERKASGFEDLANHSYTQKSVGLDPGFGSSNFGVCITELVDGLVNVIHAEKYQRPDFNRMIDITVNLLDKCSITFEGRSRIFVDGANPSFIRALKERLDEDTNYEHITSYLKKQYSSVYNL